MVFYNRVLYKQPGQNGEKEKFYQWTRNLLRRLRDVLISCRVFYTYTWPFYRMITRYWTPCTCFRPFSFRQIPFWTGSILNPFSLRQYPCYQNDELNYTKLRICLCLQREQDRGSARIWKLLDLFLVLKLWGSTCSVNPPRVGSATFVG